MNHLLYLIYFSKCRKKNIHTHTHTYIIVLKNIDVVIYIKKGKTIEWREYALRQVFVWDLILFGVVVHR